MKIFLRIFIGLVAFAILVKILTIIFVEPWAGRKIQAALNENSKDYTVEISKARILFFMPGINLKSITIRSKEKPGVYRNVFGRIASIRIVGINFAKILFKTDYSIRKITISNSSFWGNIPFSGKDSPPIIAKSNIRVDRIIIDKIDMSIQNSLTAQAFSLKEGVINVFNLKIDKLDTISPASITKIDCDVKDFFSIATDSMYTYAARRILYSATSNILMVDSLSIHPTYSDYDFTSRHEYQTDRIEADFSNIYVHGFNAAGYIGSKSVVSSYVEIGKMDMTVFRDMREKFRHVAKPTFQNMIYDYPGIIHVDSVGILKGNITYVEHAIGATEAGEVSFNDIQAKVYNITNNTFYKKNEAYLELKANTLLMGVSKLTVALKGRIYDIDNTISLTGYLSGMDASDLNPILEKNAFIYATDGKIDRMKFEFSANNVKSTGKMTLLYHGLNIAVKNKKTNDTTAIKERVISMIANIKLINSNPLKGEKVREGIIEYKRDPERSPLNYYFKSVLSGVKSTIKK